MQTIKTINQRMDVIASLLFFQDTIASHGMRDLKKQAN